MSCDSETQRDKVGESDAEKVLFHQNNFRQKHFTAGVPAKGVKAATRNTAVNDKCDGSRSGVGASNDPKTLSYFRVKQCE